MGKRRTARIIAMNAIFQAEVGKQSLNQALVNVLSGMEDEDIKAFVEENVRGCWENLKQIDQLLTALLKKWKLDRLQSVEKAILRLALYEMFYRKDIPPKVVINEAIEIAKQFGDTESGSFVNGILGAALRQLQEAQ